MKILNILCGISILFTSLAYAHLLHHHFSHSPQEALRNPLLLAAFLLAAAAGLLSFTGAFLLLKRPTNSK